MSLQLAAGTLDEKTLDTLEPAADGIGERRAHGAELAEQPGEPADAAGTDSPSFSSQPPGD